MAKRKASKSLEEVTKEDDDKSCDCAFLVDCTGSMSSWIQATRDKVCQLVDELKNASAVKYSSIQAISLQETGIKLRLCFVGYRDYVRFTHSSMPDHELRAFDSKTRRASRS